MLSYKSRWYGSQLVQADRPYPSSKTCTGCGRRKSNRTLADRVSTVIWVLRSTSPDSAYPHPWVNRVPPGVARWQDVEPRVRPNLHQRVTQQATKRQPRTANEWIRRGPPHRKARLPDESRTHIRSTKGNGLRASIRSLELWVIKLPSARICS
ncbi:transposase [Mycobacterium avium]|uniref:transposase n=1 Tax=Mycobacterium avium TaxID=1764 RepID=UPI001E344411|nr:transposase [Mycobacterium avium]